NSRRRRPTCGWPTRSWRARATSSRAASSRRRASTTQCAARPRRAPHSPPRRRRRRATARAGRSPSWRGCASSRRARTSRAPRHALLTLRAPVDATVLTRTAEPGDTAQTGRAILTLAQNGETRVIATVDEKNLRYLRAGQRASALADAFPAQPFEAELFYVAP